MTAPNKKVDWIRIFISATVFFFYSCLDSSKNLSNTIQFFDIRKYKSNDAGAILDVWVPECGVVWTIEQSVEKDLCIAILFFFL